MSLADSVLSSLGIKSTKPISIPEPKIASTGNPGIVQVGAGLTISTAGILSATGCDIIGNWTPMISSGGEGTILLHTKTGKYNKTNQLVTCTFDIEVINISWGTDADVIKLTNLPFTSVPSTGYVGSMYFSYFEKVNENIDYISGSVLPSGTTLDLWATNSEAKSMTRLTQGGLKVGSRLVGTIEYFSSM
jgi:hypothetical protein